MAKRKDETSLQQPKKKVCLTFKQEWLNAIVQTDTSDGLDKSVKLSEIFSYGANGIVCKICSEAKIKGEFSFGNLTT